MEGAKERKKILFVVLSLNVGGLERMVIDLMAGLDSSKFELMLCCLEEYGALADTLPATGIPIFCLRKKDGLQPGIALQLARVVREHNVDLVHTHNSAAHLYGSVAAKLAGLRKVVHTKHGRNRPEDKHGVWRNRCSAWFTDRVVTVSEDAMELCLSAEKVPRRKLQVIPNGIDISHYQRSNVRDDGSEITVGHVGRLAAVKNQHTLLRVFRRFLDAHPRAQLHLVGEGPERENLESFGVQLGISDKVHFYGHRADVSEILQHFTWFVLSSRSEGMPLAVIEAMSVGMPVVATDVGGMRELISHGENGFLIALQDEDAMLQSWFELAANPRLVKQMGNTARRMVEQKWSLNRMVQRYERLYEELLGM